LNVSQLRLHKKGLNGGRHKDSMNIFLEISLWSISISCRNRYLHPLIPFSIWT